MRRQILIVTLAVLALRLPFLQQAIQGDDVYYLYGAEHALIDPLHPAHAHYAFLGRVVDMRGHPHPPFNLWYLGALLALLGQVREAWFHAAYIPFSLLAAWSALWIARRFSSRPLAATCLFLATPAFVINGTSLETDLPFVAFWLAALALFVHALDRRSMFGLTAFAVAMTLAVFTAYQAILLLPILFLYGRKWRPAWAALCVAPALIVAWQLFERVTGGALPAAVLTGYMQTYGLQTLFLKARNATALTVHLAWLAFPVLAWIALRPKRRWLYLLVAAAMIGAAGVDGNPLFWLSIGTGILILLWCFEHTKDFPAQWILIFFAGALLIFFAGSARYLLPIALPVAIVIANRLSTPWLFGGITLGLALSLALAIGNYEVWNGYRQFARDLRPYTESKRVWVNGEWGLRFYLEAAGALPLLTGQILHPDEVLVSSAYGEKLDQGRLLTTVAQREITPSLPFRLFSKSAKSGYSSAQFGLLPFDLSTAPVDRPIAQLVVERKPQLESLNMSSAASADQIVSGVYNIENGQYRWMGEKAVLLLKPPARPASLEVRFFIPDQAPARKLTVFAGGIEVASQTYPAPGTYALVTPPVAGDTVTILVDRTFSVPGDQRRLGIVLTQVGFTSGKSGQSGNR